LKHLHGEVIAGLKIITTNKYFKEEKRLQDVNPENLYDYQNQIKNNNSR
jgi:hypothetical protein